jgi:hypothetical protein
MNVWGSVKKFSVGGMFLGALVLASSLTLTGCLTDDKEDEPPAGVHTNLGAETTVSVGAQGHATLGTAVDLDTKTVLLSAAANAAQGTIDVLFAYSGSAFKLMSPIAAKAAGDVALALNYNSSELKVTEFVKVSAKPADSEAAAKAFSDAATKLTSSTIAAGDKFVVKTGLGKIVYLSVTSIAGAEKNAAADLALAISAL